MDKNEFKEYEEQFYNKPDLGLYDLLKFCRENREQVDKQKLSLKALELYVVTRASCILHSFIPNYLEEKDKYYDRLPEVLKEYEKELEKADINDKIEDVYYSSGMSDEEKKSLINNHKKNVINLSKMIDGINLDMLFSYPYYFYYFRTHDTNAFCQIAELLNGVNVELFEEAFISLSNSYFEIIKFAKNVPGANIDKLEDKAIQLGIFSVLLDFLIEIKGANKQKLRDVIIRIVKSNPIQINEQYDLDEQLENIFLITEENVSHEYMEDLYLELKDIYNAEIEKSHVLTKNK